MEQLTKVQMLMNLWNLLKEYAFLEMHNFGIIVRSEGTLSVCLFVSTPQKKNWRPPSCFTRDSGEFSCQLGRVSGQFSPSFPRVLHVK